MPLFDFEAREKEFAARCGNFKLAALVPNGQGFCSMHVTAG
jgi:hypothetical protein